MPDRDSLDDRRNPHVAVIGGGAAGTLAAIHLLARDGQHRVSVIEPAERLGRGVAYGTVDPEHLLNVRASGMSAFPDRPHDFAEWAHRHDDRVAPSDFVPRMLFGRYLEETLLAHASRAGGRALRHHRTMAAGIAPDGQGGWHVTLADGASVTADHVVLATGNRPPVWSGLPDTPAVVRDPWSGLDGLPDGRILLIGSGLTAMDVLLTLRRRPRSRFVMVSRHGLRPEAHREQVLEPRAAAAVPTDPGASTARGLLRAVRTDARDAGDWRRTVDGLRPVTADLWRGLTAGERRRALRHLGRRWEVVRHRMAPAVHEAIEDLTSQGRLRTIRGRVTTIERTGGGLLARIVTADGDPSEMADGVVLCTGPSLDPLHDPFLRALLERGIAVRHAIGSGIEVTHDGRVIADDGRPWPRLWSMGGLRRGEAWESTAVPELRQQAAAAAAAMLDPVGSGIP